MYSTQGKHVIEDLWEVDPKLLNDAETLKTLLEIAAINAGATVIGSMCKQFDPQGATAIVLLSESHISIHTYPEKGFAALDCYTCGDMNPVVATRFVKDMLRPKKVNQTLLTRGGETGITKNW